MVFSRDKHFWFLSSWSCMFDILIFIIEVFRFVIDILVGLQIRCILVF